MENTETDKITKEDLLDSKKPRTQEQLDKENERLKAKLYEQENQNKQLLKQVEDLKEGKKKPGITVIDEDGNQERKRRPDTNRWGLSQLVLPPYTKGRVAIYKVCEGDEGKNPATGLPVEPFDVSISGQYTFHDKFERDAFKKDKIIQNITGSGTDIVDGKPVLKEDVEDVIFHRGFLQVPVESEYPLYVFMELHPNNKSNKFRPNNAPIIFERMDISTKSIASQAASVDLALDAGNSVREMSKEEVLGYAAAAGISTAATRMPSEIKHDLKVWAMSNPVQFYKLNKNAKAAIQIVVLDAIGFGLIGYRPDKKSYVDLESDDIISTHTASEDPMSQLVKFLGKEEGKEWYEHIQKRLNYWS